MTRSDTKYSLELIPESQMSGASDQAIRDLLCQCFRADAEAFATSRAWHDSAPEFSVVCRDGEFLWGHVGMVIRTVRCGDATVAVAGVQNLCVTPEHRGTGLSHALMDRALREAARRQITWGLLFCVPELEHFYKAQGWHRTDLPVTMLDEDGRRVPIPDKNITMTIELSDKPFPPGPIDLAGRDW